MLLIFQHVIPARIIHRSLGYSTDMKCIHGGSMDAIIKLNVYSEAINVLCNYDCKNYEWQQR